MYSSLSVSAVTCTPHRSKINRILIRWLNIILASVASPEVGAQLELGEGLRATRALWFQRRFFKKLFAEVGGKEKWWSLASTEHRVEARVT